MFHNGNFRYLENFLQRKRKTRRTRERVLEHLEVKVLKVSLGVGFKDVPVCPKKL